MDSSSLVDQVVTVYLTYDPPDGRALKQKHFIKGKCGGVDSVGLWVTQSAGSPDNEGTIFQPWSSVQRVIVN